jgi:small subunit ribosomal protein S1
MSDPVAGKSPVSSQRLQEQYIDSIGELQEGQLVNGVVIEVGPEFVFVDVGLKSEGRIPLEEFDAPPEVGSRVEVVLVRKESRSGDVLVSKRQADEQVLWRDLKVAEAEIKPVPGLIARKIKGGYEVDLGASMRAFVPFSKVDVMRVRDEDAYVGVTTQFLVEQLFNRGKANIVLNRKAWLEREAHRKRDEFYETAQVGDVYRGTVKTFTSFGVFIDLGGFDGLLHVNDMRWGHVSSPRDIVDVGEEIDTRVVRIDRETKKVNLSLKHFEEDPWTTFEEHFELDQVVQGKVIKIADFGAFIEIAEGIEGLLHISDMSWVRKVGHPREILNQGDEVEVKILGYDLGEAKLSLGLKHVVPNPWDGVEDRYRPGKVVKGTVRNVTNYGAFVRLEEGVDGLIHVEDMSWTKKVRNPSSVVAEEQEIEVVVLEVDRSARRIRLGMKQLTDDPWQALSTAYPKGTQIEGEVTSKTDFGVFVRVQGGIEGLIPLAHLTQDDRPRGERQTQTETPDPDSPVAKAMEKIEVGAKLTAIVTELSVEKQRLALSLREYRKQEERKEMFQYMQDDEEPDKVSLGDMIKDRTSS